MQKYNEFKKRVFKHLEQYKQNTMPDIDDGTFRNKKYGHILPEDERNRNLLPLSVGILDQNYHMYAHHLNSSQMMCINFFSPLFNDESILIELICKQLNLSRKPDMKIKQKEFEYTPNGSKHTNFDFYIELTTGEKIYFEIKYTENGFGGITIDDKYPERYQREWDSFYKLQTDRSIYLKGISQEDFYSNYQINRNIAYVTEENASKEYVCFVYPFDNENLHKEMEGIDFPNVIKINWDDFCNTILSICTGTKYYDHYKEFREKYLYY